MRVDAPVQHASTMPSERRLPDWAIILAAAAAAVVVVAILARPPAHVDSIQITNASSYQLTVDARTAEGASAMRLGTVPRDGTSTFREVVDHGDEWVLSFSYAGKSGGDVTVSRADLERGWTVPPEVDAALRAEGLRPSVSGQSTSPGAG